MSKIVTGMTGTDHVTGDDDSSFNRGIVGPDDYILSDSEVSAVETSNGVISLPKMEISIMGTHCRVDTGETVSIENGTVGKYRNDLICGTYTKNSSNVESFSVEVVQGTSGNSGVDPTLTKGNIRTGALKRQVALFRVRLYGSTIQKIERVIPIVDSLHKHQQAYNSLVNTVSGVSAKANTAYDRSKTNKDDITALKSKLDFSGALKSVSEYGKAVMSSWASATFINGVPSYIAARLGVTDTKGDEKCSWRVYSDGRFGAVFNNAGSLYDYSECYTQSGTVIFTNPTQNTNFVVGKVTLPSSSQNIGSVTLPTSVGTTTIPTGKIGTTASINGSTYSVNGTGGTLNVTGSGNTLNVKGTGAVLNVIGTRGEPITKSVTFPHAYTEAPVVIATPVTSDPNVCRVSVVDITKTGFKLVFARDNDVDTSVKWIATGKIGG